MYLTEKANKKKKPEIILIFYYFVLMCLIESTSCGFLSTSRLFSGEELVRSPRITTIPFEQRMGLIVTKTKIKGKEREFIFDTGAPCLLSK